MVSASMRWLMDIMIPTDISVEITCIGLTFIIVASSDTVTNSVSFSTLLCACSADSSSLKRS